MVGIPTDHLEQLSVHERSLFRRATRPNSYWLYFCLLLFFSLLSRAAWLLMLESVCLAWPTRGPLCEDTASGNCHYFLRSQSIFQNKRLSFWYFRSNQIDLKEEEDCPKRRALRTELLTERHAFSRSWRGFNLETVTGSLHLSPQSNTQDGYKHSLTHHTSFHEIKLSWKREHICSSWLPRLLPVTSGYSVGC